MKLILENWNNFLNERESKAKTPQDLKKDGYYVAYKTNP